jgi:hypothetical protein
VKIGRNDPCPCGSGRKYKKCCLLKEKEPENVSIEAFVADATSMRMGHLLTKERGWTVRRYQEPALKIEREILSEVPQDCVLSQSQSEKLLMEWNTRLEDEVAKLCATHSKYYWLYLSRRISPETQGYDLITTTWLYRTTLNLAMLKYGLSDADGEFIAVPSSANLREWIFSEAPYEGETIDLASISMAKEDSPLDVTLAASPIIIPRQVTLEDAIRIYQIEHLAHEYYITTAELRRVWKGGKLRIQNGLFAGVALPAEIEGLVALYDKRVEQYNRLLSEFGSIVNLHIPEDGKFDEGFILVVPFWNIHKQQIPLIFPGEEFPQEKGPSYPEPNPFNFVPVPQTLEPFYRKACIFSKPIEVTFGISPEELTTFLVALSRHNFHNWANSLRHRYNFFQRGYFIRPDKEEFHQDITNWYRDTFEQLFGNISTQEASFAVSKLMSWQTYEEKDFAQISLYDRTGAKLILATPAGLLFDCVAIPSVLGSIFAKLSYLASADGKIGQLKGDDFELEAKRYLAANVPGFSPWMCHRELQSMSGHKMEVDISFCKDQVLFVLECKAFKVSTGFDRGQPKELETRRQKLEEALDKVETLANMLAKEPRGRNYTIPDGITHIISIVVSPFPEYVHQRSGRYFLTESIPRICTVEELTKFLNKFALSAYIDKQFVVRIS